jgi:hypothetical protein
MFFRVLSGQRSQIVDGTFANLSIRSSISGQGGRILTDDPWREEQQTCHPFGVNRLACVSASTNMPPLRGSSALKLRVSHKSRMTLKSGKRLHRFLHYSASVFYELQAGGVHARMNAAQRSSFFSQPSPIEDSLI